MKKIVHITQSMKKGGAEKLIFDLSVLSVEKYEVYVICQYPKIDPQFMEDLTKKGVNVILLDKKPGLDFNAFKQLYKTLKKINPDVIHTHIQSAIYAVPYYLFHRRCKKIHTIHTVPEMEFTKAHMLFQRFAYKFLGVVPVAIGDEIRKKTIKQYRLPEKKVKLIYNGVRLENFYSGEKDEYYFDLVCVANFSKWKNQQMLLKVMKNLNMDIRLSLAGSGECLNDCKKLSKSLQLNDRVKFLGRVDDVPNLLSHSHILMLSSEFEGIPLTVIEAFASSIPVISTDVGSVCDLVENGVNGYRVPFNNINEMANKIVKLKNDKVLYKKICENNKEKSLHFGIDGAVKKYHELYEGREI